MTLTAILHQVPNPIHPHVIRILQSVVLCALLAGSDPSLAEPSAHPSFEEFDADVERLRAINGGELRFLPDPNPADRRVHTETTYLIEPDSLTTGWIEMRQCQHELDPIERVEIQYDYAELRDLRVTETQGITEHWVDGQSVQLRGVGVAAHVCVSAQVRILRRDADGIYRLCSGPYHRRFLDGYFPLRLSLRIQYPADLLTLLGSDPPVQAGLDITSSATGVQVHAQFVGSLMLRFRFSAP